MKHRFKIMTLVIIVSMFVLTACGEKTYTASDFVGVWDSEYELGDETVEFFSDGTFEKVANSFLGSIYVTGKYTVEADKVTVSFDQTGEIDTYTYRFVADDKMIWTWDAMEDVDYTYIKR